MKPTLVDSNVILDLVSEDPVWFEWSSEALARCADESPIVINPIVYAEVSVAFTRVEDVEETLSPRDFERESLPWEAGFLAGRCFVLYRRRGGTRRSPLPDFYIGAHAATRGFRLLTRDPKRYRSYFPGLELICPSRA